jgi:hypothetical protein
MPSRNRAPSRRGWQQDSAARRLDRELATRRSGRLRGYEPLPVCSARTWLLSRGWMRGGPPIALDFVPGVRSIIEVTE